MRIASVQIRRAVLLALCAAGTPTAHSQASAPRAVSRETSVTLPQIVARQTENFRKIINAKGEVIWREDMYTTGTSAPPLRVISFAFEGNRSVNLIIPWDGVSPLPRRGEKLDWSKVLSAALVEGDIVRVVSLKRGANSPVTETVPFNPAVHERNPLIAFHPAMLGDDRVGLADLASAAARMTARPLVAEIGSGERTRIRVAFTNPSSPGDILYYIINPQKGWLAEDIGRLSGGRYLFRSRIVIGNTSDGVWIPARRMKEEFSADGKLLRREIWQYNSLSVNSGVARRELSMDFFHLPAESLPTTMQTNSPSETPAAGSRSRKPAKGTLAPPRPGPVPRR